MPTSFSSRYRAAMVKEGFSIHGRGVIVRSGQISCISFAEVARAHPYVVFGLWFSGLDDADPPLLYNHFHCYGGVSCLGFDWRIRTAKYDKSANELAIQLDKALALAPAIATRLKMLISLDNVLEAERAGVLNRCSVIRIARAFLDDLQRG